MLKKTLSKIHETIIELSDEKSITCRIPYIRIAQESGYSKSSVKRAIRILVREGFIKKHQNNADKTSTNILIVCKKFT